MSRTMVPTQLDQVIERFQEVFPHERDYFMAFGFFKALGLSEPEARVAAEAIATQGNDERRKSRFSWQPGQVTVLSPENEAREKP